MYETHCLHTHVNTTSNGTVPSILTLEDNNQLIEEFFVSEGWCLQWEKVDYSRPLHTTTSVALTCHVSGILPNYSTHIAVGCSGSRPQRRGRCHATDSVHTLRKVRHTRSFLVMHNWPQGCSWQGIVATKMIVGLPWRAGNSLGGCFIQ